MTLFETFDREPLFKLCFLVDKMKIFRPAVIRMHERGIGQREIARLLGIPLTTVHDDIRRFEETART